MSRIHEALKKAAEERAASVDAASTVPDFVEVGASESLIDQLGRKRLPHRTGLVGSNP